MTIFLHSIGSSSIILIIGDFYSATPCPPTWMFYPSISFKMPSDGDPAEIVVLPTEIWFPFSAFETFSYCIREAEIGAFDMLETGKLMIPYSCLCKNVDLRGVWFAVLIEFFFYLVFWDPSSR